MGVRRDALVYIKDSIDGLVDANGRTIHAVNTYFDPLQIISSDDPSYGLPKFSVVPDPETIILGLSSIKGESVMRVAIIGYCYAAKESTLFLDAEDIVERIVNELMDAVTETDLRNLTTTCGVGITEIGPIVVEQFDDVGHLAFISIPATLRFLRG